MSFSLPPLMQKHTFQPVFRKNGCLSPPEVSVDRAYDLWMIRFICLPTGRHVPGHSPNSSGTATEKPLEAPASRGFLVRGFSQLSERLRAKQKSTRYAGGNNLLYKKHLSHTIELFKPIVIFKGKVFLYGNSSSKFSPHKMVVQVSHCLFSKIQAENNICQHSRKYRRNS